MPNSPIRPVRAKTSILLGSLVLLLFCGSGPVQENLGQTDPQWNRSRTIYVTFFIREIHGLADQLWIPTITDLEGNVLYEDISSGCSSYEDNYWAWDRENRLWFYNTATQKAWVYFQDKARWQKVFYSERCGIDAPDFILKRIEEGKMKDSAL